MLMANPLLAPSCKNSKTETVSSDVHYFAFLHQEVKTVHTLAYLPPVTFCDLIKRTKEV